jgi:hypothetical protein
MKVRRLVSCMKKRSTPILISKKWTLMREVSNWFYGELDPPEDVELEGYGMPINVFDHVKQLQQPTPDAFCSFCQESAEEETEADGPYWWVRTQAYFHMFHTTCLSDLLNFTPPGKDDMTCPLCNTVVCPRRKTRPVTEDNNGTQDAYFDVFNESMS